MLELYNAAQTGDLDLVESFIIEGANVNETNEFGDTPLGTACYEGHFEIARLLIVNEADIHAANSAGLTVIHNACSNGNIEIIKLLLAKGADVNAVSNVSGSTPLHCACLGTPPYFERNIEAVKLLIEKGADVNAINNKQNKPLAIANRNVELAKLLIPHMLVKKLKQEKPYNIQNSQELSLFWDEQVEMIGKRNALIHELGKPLTNDIFNKITSEQKGLTLIRLSFQFFKPSTTELNILEAETVSNVASSSRCKIL